MSLIESATNRAIGYLVALISQLMIFPFFDIEVSITSHLLIGFWFTLVSLIRSYALRRWLNRVEPFLII